jgi:hypothetical protein
MSTSTDQMFKHFLGIGINFMSKIWREAKKCDRIYEDPPEKGKTKVRFFKRVATIFTDKVFPRNPGCQAKAKRPLPGPVPTGPDGMPLVDPMTGQFSEPIDMGPERAEVVAQLMTTLMEDMNIESEYRACCHEGFIRPATGMECGYDQANPTGVWARKREITELVVDPNAKLYFGAVHDCRFIGVKLKLTEDEAKALELDISKIPSSDIENEVGPERHENTSDDNLIAESREADEGIAGTSTYSESNAPDMLNKRFVVWRIYYKNPTNPAEQLLAYISEHADECAKPPEPWPWKLNCFPIHLLGFDNIPGRPFGHSPLWDLQEQQEEMTSIRTTINKDVVESAPINFYDKSMETEVTAAIANRCKDLWVGIEGLASRGVDAFVQRRRLEGLQGDSLNLYNLIREEIQEISGVSDNDRLENSDMTATEASIIDAANKVATGAKATTMLRFQDSVIRCLHQIIEQTFEEDRINMVIGPDGAQKWVAWNGPGYFGDFDISVDSTAARSNDPEVLKAEDAQILEATMKVGGNVQYAFNQWLKSMGRKHPEHYAPPPMPLGMPGMPGMPGPGGPGKLQ